ncbi:MAG: SDR family oxidoreductase [Alphaproteobacteria bacterium]|nr:SDR family oxidoreductase [Alphaproteobacteria bacterium]
MDLGIKGKKAIVCASSKGLGKACAMALAADGAEVVVNGRNEETVNAAVAEIRAKTGATVHACVADVTTQEGRDKLLALCPEPDILVNNAGGPPPGDFRDWDAEHWQEAVNNNMITPILLIRSVVDGMMDRKWGRIVNITSAAVKAPIEILGLSNGARAGLTGFVAGLSRKTVANNVTINGLLPGPFDTDRLAQTMGSVAEKTGKPVEEIRAVRAAENPAGRFGTAEEFGAFCAFLCSDHAGYVTGQNIVMDGGAYPGTL